MTDNTMDCPCGERGTWLLAKHDQWHKPWPPPGQLGVEIPVYIDHPDGTRHRVHHVQAVG